MDQKLDEENETKSEPKQDIPHDVLVHQILTRLPIKTLIQFKSVSKQWYSSISSDHHFANTHFKLSPFACLSFPTQLLFIQHDDCYYILCYDDDDEEIDVHSTKSKSFLIKLKTIFDAEKDEFELVGSCNGLVCLASYTGNILILWNPINKKFQKYYTDSESMNSYSNTKYRICWGFGYVSSKDDYKIVRIIELPETLEIIVHVFSLRSKKWRKIGNEDYQHVLSLRDTEWYLHGEDKADRQYVSVISSPGVSVNNRMYWLAGKIQESVMNLVAFDLEIETFQVIPDLKLRYSEEYEDKFLCVMGGCLSKCGFKQRGDVSIATLKVSGKLNTIRVHRNLKLNHCKDLIGFTKTGRIFVNYRGAPTLAVLDPTSKPMRFTQFLEFHQGQLHICSFVPSLISPFIVEELPEV